MMSRWPGKVASSLGERRQVASTRWGRLLFVLLVLTITGLSYLPAFEAGFVWDDFPYLVENLTLRSLDGLIRIWFDLRASPQYYPLVYTTFWNEYRFWQLVPTGYHATNILLHGLNATLVWVLLRKLSMKGAWLAALIFAVHPVHVESVAWVSERKNVLSGLFYLGSTLSYLRFRGLEAEHHSGRWPSYALALLLFVFALLSKSVTASLPAAILLVLYWKTGKVRLRDMILLVPFFAAGIAAGLHTAWLERIHVGASGPIWDFTLSERMLIASRALCHYVSKLLWPEALTFIYPRWNIDAGQAWQYAYGVALCGLMFSLWYWRHSRRGPLVAALFFAGTLLPALGLIDIYPMRFSFVADHFQYLASLGVILPIAAGLSELGGSPDELRAGLIRRIGTVAAVLVVFVLAIATFNQARIYVDEETLWRDTLRKNPEAWMAHNNLGRVYGFRGEFDKAIEHFQRTIDLYPEYYIAETNLAEALIYVAQYEEAAGHLRNALSIEPAHADAHFLLWMALDELGETQAAISHLQRQTELTPGFAPHFRAARLLAKSNHPQEALAQLDKAEKFRPHSTAVAVDRGNLFMLLGNPRKAALAYRQATIRNPNSAVAHNLLGQALERLGKPVQAANQFAKALEIDPGHAAARANLGRLRARSGDHAD
jgi:tetratricopeptide (TPR) repeat protein